MAITSERLNQTFSEGGAQEIYQEIKAKGDFLGFAQRYAFDTDYRVARTALWGLTKAKDEELSELKVIYNELIDQAMQTENSSVRRLTLNIIEKLKVEQALLVSPILDMKRFIELMSQREDDYYEWVVNNPITSLVAPTYILRPEVDLIVSEEVGHDFISQHQCQVTIMPDGEHWFHTPEQLAFLKAWEEKTIEKH